MDGTLHYKLVQAIVHNKISKVKELLSQVKDIRVWDDIYFRLAAEGGRLKICQLLWEVGAAGTKTLNNSLAWAASHGRLNTLKFLISIGADIDFSDSKALRWAISKKQFNVARHLIKIGAKLPKNPTHHMYKALDAKEYSIVEYFLKYGMDNMDLTPNKIEQLIRVIKNSSIKKKLKVYSVLNQ